MKLTINKTNIKILTELIRILCSNKRIIVSDLSVIIRCQKTSDSLQTEFIAVAHRKLGKFF
jgi:hypothetical protein